MFVDSVGCGQLVMRLNAALQFWLTLFRARADTWILAKLRRSCRVLSPSMTMFVAYSMDNCLNIMSTYKYFGRRETLAFWRERERENQDSNFDSQYPYKYRFTDIG